LVRREEDKKLDCLINNNTDKENEDTGLVDERYELCSIIAKLAGYAGYSSNKNDIRDTYQTALLDSFQDFGNHPAVEFLRRCEQKPCYNAMFALAMSLQKNNGDFTLAESDENLNKADSRLSSELVESFLPHLNSFYTDSKFGEWFKNNTEFYREFSKRFPKAQNLDYAWFEKFGIKKENMKVVASPSHSMHNYGATLGDKTFALVQGGDGALVHEFCHSFCNPIGQKWFNENPRFKEICDNTIGHPKLHSSYCGSKSVGNEYVTRSFDIIYEREHFDSQKGDWDSRYQILLQFNGDEQGFPFLEEVLEMAKAYNRGVNKCSAIKPGGIEVQD
jgi:hypothetical protein